MANDLIQFGETQKVQGMTSLQIAEETRYHPNVGKGLIYGQNTQG